VKSKPAGWVRAFKARGIAVRRDLCRAEAVAVLREYRNRGGVIYNARHWRLPFRSPGWTRVRGG
jgi:hypothetical protein